MKPSEGWWRRVGVATGALAVAAAGWGLGAGPLAARAAGPTVSIHEGPPSCAVPSYCYAPAQVTANPGDTVTWSNASDAPHTVTRCTPAACAGAGPGTGTDVLSSPQITRGGAFTFAVHSPGTYAYYCTVHGFAVMHGTVTVAAASVPPPAAPPAAAPPAAAPPAAAPPAAAPPPPAQAAPAQPAAPRTAAPGGTPATPRTGVFSGPGELGAAAVLAAIGSGLVAIGRRRR